MFKEYVKRWLRSHGINTEKPLYIDSQQMLKDFHETLKYRGNKKWERDRPEVTYNFDDSALKGKIQSYQDILKDLRNEE